MVGGAQPIGDEAMVRYGVFAAPTFYITEERLSAGIEDLLRPVNARWGPAILKGKDA